MMGADLYRLKYELTPIPRNYELFEWISDKFGEEYGNRIFINSIEDLEMAIDELKEDTERYAKIKDTLKPLKKYIQKEDGADFVVDW